MRRNLLFAGLLLMAVGCGQSERRAESGGGGAPAASAVDGSKYIAGSEPADARHVIELRKDAKDGDQVVLVGRIGGSRTPVVSGRAAFTVVDLSLKGCGDDDSCYDFLCLPREKVARASATIKFSDDQERTLPVDVKSMLGIPDLEGKIVVISGKARRDDNGNLTVHANQFYLRKAGPVSHEESEKK